MLYGGRLENWTLSKVGGKWKISGDIHDDPKNRFDNGDFVTTSSLEQLDLVLMQAKTKNSTYALGKMA